eukprot:353928-Chlamydomonas_euryale.AAC.8
MAVLRQQAGFVQQLFEAGMVDEHEAEGLTGPIEHRIWSLEVKGPRWTHPSLGQVCATQTPHSTPTPALDGCRPAFNPRPCPSPRELLCAPHLTRGDGQEPAPHMCAYPPTCTPSFSNPERSYCD